jgi:hypothetical protein
MRWQAFRKALVQIHLWVALTLCAPMIEHRKSWAARFFFSEKFSPHRFANAGALGEGSRSPLLLPPRSEAHRQE